MTENNGQKLTKTTLGGEAYTLCEGLSFKAFKELKDLLSKIFINRKGFSVLMTELRYTYALNLGKTLNEYYLNLECNDESSTFTKRLISPSLKQ